MQTETEGAMNVKIPAVYDPARETPYSPAEVCEIARAAAKRGRVDYLSRPAWASPPATVEATYPAPYVVRPRVVTDEHGVEWRIHDNTLQWHDERGWHGHAYAEQGVRQTWISLLTTPTERVPGGES